jgi:dimethylargininase
VGSEPVNLVALTRGVSPRMGDCELTHLERVPIDVARAVAQHAAYERALEQLGCRVTRLPAGADMPDSVFIEDTALVFDEVAVIMRPGAGTRRGETILVAEALRPLRPLMMIEAPGTMDGGDVLRIGRTIFVGRSSRTNAEGIAQLSALAAPYGYTVRAVDVRGCLHLKSAATAVDDHTLLVNREWIGTGQLSSFEFVDVDPSEPGAANVARVGVSLLAAAAFPRTRERLERSGHGATVVDVSELAKAEGAVTCCSLIFSTT